MHRRCTVARQVEVASGNARMPARARRRARARRTTPNTHQRKRFLIVALRTDHCASTDRSSLLSWRASRRGAARGARGSSRASRSPLAARRAPRAAPHLNSGCFHRQLVEKVPQIQRVLLCQLLLCLLARGGAARISFRCARAPPRAPIRAFPDATSTCRATVQRLRIVDSHFFLKKRETIKLYAPVGRAAFAIGVASPPTSACQRCRQAQVTTSPRHSARPNQTNQLGVFAHASDECRRRPTADSSIRSGVIASGRV